MIYIFYPSLILGGAELLLMRLANDLYESGNKVCIVDRPLGWIARNIDNPNIEKLYFDKEKILLDDNSVLITTANYIYSLEQYFKPSKTKLLFWAVQPYNVILKTPYLHKIKILENFFINFFKEFYTSEMINKPKKIISELIENNALVSMDNECNMVLKKYYQLEYKKFLPVYIHSKPTVSNLLENNINLLWLGRVDNEFKKFILIKMLYDLSHSNYIHKIMINIVGEGDGLEEVRNYCKDITNIKFFGTLKGEELDSIINTTHIGFAMGTSALDIANRGIPTVLLDFSYQPVNNYKYRWIFDAEDFDLGRDIALLSQDTIKRMKGIDEILNELLKCQKNLGKKSKWHVERNHVKEITLSRVASYFHQISFSMEDLYILMKTKPLWLKFRFFLKGNPI